MSESDGETVDPKAPPPQLVLQIAPPITWATGKIDTLSLKEPTVGQKRTAHEQLRNGANSATVDLYEISLVSLVSGMPIGAVELLPVRIMNEAMTYLDYFLAAGRRTGWT